MKRAPWFVAAFGVGWALGWGSWFCVAAWYAYREHDA